MKIFGVQDTNNIALMRHICNLSKLSEVIRTRKCNFLSRLLSAGLYNDLFANEYFEYHTQISCVIIG